MTLTETSSAVVYADGACHGNPGPGGWGVVLRVYGEAERLLYGGESRTTNNQMELMAAIVALEELAHGSAVRLWTDSSYVRNGITSWIRGWKRNGWKTANGQPVKNQHLWQRLDAAAAAHTVDWRWVRGHNGDEGNELADSLATRGAIEFGGSSGPRPQRDRRGGPPRYRRR